MPLTVAPPPRNGDAAQGSWSSDTSAFAASDQAETLHGAPEPAPTLPASAAIARTMAAGVLFSAASMAAAATLVFLVAAVRLASGGDVRMTFDDSARVLLAVAAALGYAATLAIPAWSWPARRPTTLALAAIVTVAWPLSGHALPAVVLAVIAVGLALVRDFRTPGGLRTSNWPLAAVLAVAAIAAAITGVARAETHPNHPTQGASATNSGTAGPHGTTTAGGEGESGTASGDSGGSAGDKGATGTHGNGATDGAAATDGGGSAGDKGATGTHGNGATDGAAATDGGGTAGDKGATGTHGNGATDGAAATDGGGSAGDKGATGTHGNGATDGAAATDGGGTAGDQGATGTHGNGATDGAAGTAGGGSAGETGATGSHGESGTTGTHGSGGQTGIGQGASAPAEAPAPDAATATAFVRDYYTALNERRYEDAWAELSPAIQERFGGFAHWKRGYAQTQKSEPQNLITQTDGKVLVVSLKLVAHEENCNAVQNFRVTWRLEQVAGTLSVAGLQGSALSSRSCQ